ncbi:MAG: hypothetical protein R2795_22830, partial [Saprospiraceae bacterium]
MIFSGLPTGSGSFYVDNIYFSSSACPTAAPEPTCDAANVISLYSNSYTDVPVDTWLTPWSPGATVLTDLQLAGNDTKFYENVDFLGIEMFGTPIDASAMTTFNVDVWTSNMTTFRVKLVEFSGNTFVSEGEIALTPTQFGWNTFAIPMANFSDPTRVTNPAFTLGGTSELSQLIFSGLPTGSGSFYLDNVFFSTCEVVAPLVDVTFCVDYTCVADLTGFAAQQINFDGGTLSGFQPLVDMGNNIWCGTFALPVGETVRYSFFYAAAEGAGGLEDLTGLACENNGRRTYTVTDETTQSLTFAWESCDQAADCGPTGPAEPAPVPTCATDAVISLFSNAYTNVPVSTFLTPWSASPVSVTDVQIAGDDVKFYQNVTFLGIETTGANLIDASLMTTFNISFWSANATQFRLKLVDFGADGNFGGGDDTEHELAFSNPAMGEWITY